MTHAAKEGLENTMEGITATICVEMRKYSKLSFKTMAPGKKNLKKKKKKTETIFKGEKAG